MFRGHHPPANRRAEAQGATYAEHVGATPVAPALVAVRKSGSSSIGLVGIGLGPAGRLQELAACMDAGQFPISAISFYLLSTATRLTFGMYFSIYLHAVETIVGRSTCIYSRTLLRR